MLVPDCNNKSVGVKEDNLEMIGVTIASFFGNTM
jgi:hypothetical protein